MNTYLQVIKKRDFFLLWFGQIISQFGERVTQMALIGLVYHFRPGSSIILAKMLSLAIIPVFLISPVAGVYVDRWDKRKTMYISDLIRASFILSVPILLLISKSLWLVYIPLFLSFCIGRFFIPAKMAIVPTLVEKEEFFLANSLVSITAMIAAVLGFGIGGIIVEKIGPQRAFIFNGITFLISSVLIFFMKTETKKPAFELNDLFNLSKQAWLNIKKSFVFEIKEGFKYILASQETRYAAKVFSVLFAVVGALYTVLIVFFQEIFSSATKQVGGLAMALAIGLFLGSLLYGRIAKKFSTRQTINFCLLISNAYLGVFASILRIYPNKLFAFIFCVILGVIAAPIFVAVNTLIHKESKDEFWGRIFSSLEVIIHLAFLVFMFIASYCAELMTPYTIILSVSIIVVVLALFFLWQEKNNKIYVKD